MWSTWSSRSVIPGTLISQDADISGTLISQGAGSLPCCLRGSRSDSRAMAMTSATASTARPRTCPPSSRVLSGRESDVSVTGAPAGFGRAPVPTFGVAAGVTVGKSPPGSVGDGRKGSAAAEAAIPAGVRGGMPPGSVAPRPDGIPPDPEDAPAYGGVESGWKHQRGGQSRGAGFHRFDIRDGAGCDLTGAGRRVAGGVSIAQ